MIFCFIFLVVGGFGGFGNLYFVFKNLCKFMFVMWGENVMMMEIEMEFKLLVDVGLVGLLNVGKSIFLCVVINSCVCVGNWVFMMF